MTLIMVAFADAWLTDVSAPSVSLTASFPARSSDSTLDGAVRFYAGGRRRVITTARSTRTFPLILQWLDDSQVATLDLWRGRVLLLRDVSGRRVFGTFLSMAVEDIFQPAGTRHFVTLTFTEITYSENLT